MTATPNTQLPDAVTSLACAGNTSEAGILTALELSPPVVLGAGGNLATAAQTHSRAAVVLYDLAQARRDGLTACAMAAVMAGRATIAEAGGDFTASEIIENWLAARAMLAGSA